MDHVQWVCITLKLNSYNMENKYAIDIQGIHCNRCVNLIKMTLEEQGLTNVVVDQEKNTAEFTSKMVDADNQTIKDLLDKAFAELQTYSYLNLHIIN